MSSARNINVPQDAVSRSSLAFSTSPAALTHSNPPSFGQGISAAVAAASKHLKPFATEDIKILLLENVNQTGRDILAAQGYQVEFLKTSLPEDELIQKIR